MTFVTTSLAIAGIAAASIPILVHLLLRRRRLRFWLVVYLERSILVRFTVFQYSQSPSVLQSHTFVSFLSLDHHLHHAQFFLSS